MDSGDSPDSGEHESSRSSTFCQSCGKPVGQSHKFCRHCGQSLTEADGAASTPSEKARGDKKQKNRGNSGAAGGKVGDAPAEPKGGDGDAARPLPKIGRKADVGKKDESGAAKSTDAKAGDERKPIRERLADHKLLGAGAGAVLLAVVVASALLLTGTVGGGASDAEVASFRQGMLQRDHLVLAQMKYQGAMVTSERTVQRYFTTLDAYNAEVKRIDTANQPLLDACQAAYSNISCPTPSYPAYPKAPTVSDEVSQLKKVSNAMEALGAKIRSTEPPESLKAFYAQLTSAVDQLQGDATYNADTLTKAVSSAQGDSTGSVDKSAIATLKSKWVSASIRALNVQAVEVIKNLGLQLSDFDVPGGTDRNPDDGSVST